MKKLEKTGIDAAIASRDEVLIYRQSGPACFYFERGAKVSVFRESKPSHIYFELPIDDLRAEQRSGIPASA